MMDREGEYFARVVPVLGDGLIHGVVCLEGISLLSRVAELLVSCRLQRFVVRDRREPATWPMERSGIAQRELAAHLAWKNGFVPVRWKHRGRADLYLRARLAGSASPARIDWDESHARITMHVPAGNDDAWRDLSITVARAARDLLLRRLPWPRGTTLLGHEQWPWAQRAVEAVPGDSHGRRCARRDTKAAVQERGAPAGPHVMVIGLGSVGSEVVRGLAPEVGRWTLVDGAAVTVHNPHRQWFGTGEIGTPKAAALATRLQERTRDCPRESFRNCLPRALRGGRGIVRRLTGEDVTEMERLLDEDRPDLVVLATGTRDDIALAAAIQRRDLPHVVAYAYPRARFFEVSVVERGTPCLGCYRGHLHPGPAPALPMSDELGSMLYAMPAGEDRDRAFTDLVAEPATAIETGRLVDVVLRCARQLLRREGTREAWFRRMIDEGTTCLLGANMVEIRQDGELAYGLSFPGQVVRLGLEDIVGVGEAPVCRSCGRRLAGGTVVSLPRAVDDEADRALLEALVAS